jgi:deazaflavin-dependent oxidoreductase (nitroreductase family)
LKYVDPLEPPGRLSRLLANLANTRLGRFLSVHEVWKLDPPLMRLSRGRLGLGLMLPTALLETRGARSGAVRRNAVIYFNDGERVTIVASKLGRPEDPAWFLNLRANPEMLLGGEPMRAAVVEDEAERPRDPDRPADATLIGALFPYAGD